MNYKKYSDLHLFLIVFALCNILHFTVQSNEPVDYFAQGLERIGKTTKTFSKLEKELYEAIQNNDLNGIKNILKNNKSINFELTTHPDTNKTLLGEAIYKNNKDVVNLFINAGANINTRANKNQSVIEYAIASGADKEIITSLLSDKNVIITDPKNKSLFTAVYNGNIDILKVLLEDGRFNNINYQDPNDGNTLLHYVAKQNIYGPSSSEREEKQKKLTQFLLDNGAQKGIKNNDDKTPYDVALATASTPEEIRNLLKQ